jgi:hypothetical protein
MEELVRQLPTVLKNIVSEYTFHTIHREQISETLHNIKVRGVIDNERTFWSSNEEEDEQYIKLCNTCTCCLRHGKNKPKSLHPNDHKDYVVIMYKGLELYKKGVKQYVCSCKCRHICRNIVRKRDPFGYNEYFQCRAFFIHNYVHVTQCLTDLTDMFQTISSSPAPAEISYLHFINLLRSLNRNKIKLKTKLVKLHTALRNITPNSISPLIDHKETPNLHHKYIHLWDDIHELLYDIKAYIKTESANEILQEALQELHHLDIS